MKLCIKATLIQLGMSGSIHESLYSSEERTKEEQISAADFKHSVMRSMQRAGSTLALQEGRVKACI